jgi:hypothetical protein
MSRAGRRAVGRWMGGRYTGGMPIEHEEPRKLPPLKVQRPPLVPVDALVAVADVRLAASDVPAKVLRHFYEAVIGLKFVEADGERLVFTQHRRRILLERERGVPGQVGFIVRDFGESLLRLRDHSVPYELLHTDAGLTRSALVRDPAGNWLQLVETRAF